MAEGVGFEPTEACDLSGFQDRCNKPLYHPSKYWEFKVMDFTASSRDLPRLTKTCLNSLTFTNLPREISLSEDLIALPLEYGRGALVVIDMKD